MKINPLSKNSKKKEKIKNLMINIDREDTGNSSNIHLSTLQIVLSILFLITILSALYFGVQYFVSKPKLDNPSLLLNQQSQDIKTDVGKLIDLYDTGEISVISITNIDNLKKENAEFYKNAKNGDFVLVSPKRAILYSKDRNIILNIAPIFNSQSTSVSGTPAVTPNR